MDRAAQHADGPALSDHGDGRDKHRPITLGTFTTPDLLPEPGEFLVTINWGDERTLEGMVEGGNGTFTIKADHNFDAAGTLTVSVDIWNIWGALPEVDVSTTATVPMQP